MITEMNIKMKIFCDVETFSSVHKHRRLEAKACSLPQVIKSYVSTTKHEICSTHGENKTDKEKF